MAPWRCKLVLLGEGRVGKTSIVVRYVLGTYDDQQASTLQASYLDKTLVLAQPQGQVHLSIWDTAGQEHLDYVGFHALGPIYYRDADGALLVYDITDSESFAKVRKWVRELRHIVGSDIAITIAGNKSDLEARRAVDETEALNYATTVNATHVYTSAKQNRGIDEAFTDLARRMATRKAEKQWASVGAGLRAAISIVDDDPAQPAPKKKCCA